jgi:hypothetical protein
MARDRSGAKETAPLPKGLEAGGRFTAWISKASLRSAPAVIPEAGGRPRKRLLQLVPAFAAAGATTVAEPASYLNGAVIPVDGGRVAV